MSKLKSINDEYKMTLGIRNLVSTYQEIASLRMRSVRDYVLQNREYFNGINKIYSLVINSYITEASYRKNKRKSISVTEKTALLRRNGKTLYVFLSSNTLLYGSIVQDTFAKFKENVITHNDVDLAVIGKVGKVLMLENLPDKTYSYFDLADTLDDTVNIKKIQEYLVQYEKVVVFHGVFDSLLSQKPKASYITGAATENIPANAHVHFMFEPNLDDVLLFFENQIVGSSFIQSLNEAYLSKYASRMISLDFALNDIDKKLKNLHLSGQKAKHTITNKKQQDILSGRILWKM